MMNREEFEVATEELICWAKEYNSNSDKPISISLLSIPDRCYMKTASVYLQIGETAQVFYSPSYQVPVFYFPYDNTLTAVGSGEGPKISYAEHPITGLPVSFLHPCQTAAVIGELYANSPFGLLLKWLGAYWQEVPNVRIPAKFFSILNREPLK